MASLGHNELTHRNLNKMTWHFIHTDDIFECIILIQNYFVLIQFLLKFVTKGSTNNYPALIQVTARCRTGAKPLSETMMAYHVTCASLGLDELKSEQNVFRFTDDICMYIFLKDLLNRIFHWSLFLKARLTVSQYWVHLLYKLMNNNILCIPNLCKGCVWALLCFNFVCYCYIIPPLQRSSTGGGPQNAGVLVVLILPHTLQCYLGIRAILCDYPGKYPRSL